MSDEKQWMKELGGAVFILFLGFTAVIGTAKLFNKFKEPTEVILPPNIIYKTEPRPVVSCSDDFLSYQKLAEDSEHVVSLISERKAKYAENRGFVNSEVIITKNETQESRVACGYLFVIDRKSVV